MLIIFIIVVTVVVIVVFVHAFPVTEVFVSITHLRNFSAHRICANTLGVTDHS